MERKWNILSLSISQNWQVDFWQKKWLERPMQGLSIDILGLKIYNGDPSISAINQEKQLTDIRTFRNVLWNLILFLTNDGSHVETWLVKVCESNPSCSSREIPFQTKKNLSYFGGQILEVEEANCIIFFNKIIATQSTFATMMKFVCLLDGNIAFLWLTKNSDLPSRFPGHHERLP